MKRRKLLTAGLSLGVITGAGGISYALFKQDERLGKLALTPLIARLESMQQLALISTGQWSPAQIFDHCAQSVDFSMSGFPEHKSDTFKSTVGATAFATFSLIGKMKHNLNEAIPGAPALVSRDDAAAAIERLIGSLQKFQAFNGALAPHFAFGELSKADYALAHAMHIYNHFDELTILQSAIAPVAR